LSSLLQVKPPEGWHEEHSLLANGEADFDVFNKFGDFEEQNGPWLYKLALHEQATPQGRHSRLSIFLTFVAYVLTKAEQEKEITYQQALELVAADAGQQRSKMFFFSFDSHELIETGQFLRAFSQSWTTATPFPMRWTWWLPCFLPSMRISQSKVTGRWLTPSTG
jgi:hypothetical protein